MRSGSVASGAIVAGSFFPGSPNEPITSARREGDAAATKTALLKTAGAAHAGQKRSAGEVGLEERASGYLSPTLWGTQSNDSSACRLRALCEPIVFPKLSSSDTPESGWQRSKEQSPSSIEIRSLFATSNETAASESGANIIEHRNNAQGLADTKSESNLPIARSLSERAAAYQAPCSVLTKAKIADRTSDAESCDSNLNLHEDNALQDTASRSPAVKLPSAQAPTSNLAADLMRRLEARFDAAGNFVEPQACGSYLDQQFMQTALRLWTANDGNQERFLSHLGTYLYAQEAFDNENVGGPQTRMPLGAEPMVWNLMLQDPMARSLFRTVIANRVLRNKTDETFAGRAAACNDLLNKINNTYPMNHAEVNIQAALNTIEWLRQSHRIPTAAS